MSVEARARSWVLARAVRRVMARERSLTGVRAVVEGVEIGDEEVEEEGEDD
jgi:hypothetical protein